MYLYWITCISFTTPDSRWCYYIKVLAINKQEKNFTTQRPWRDIPYSNTMKISSQIIFTCNEKFVQNISIIVYFYTLLCDLYFIPLIVGLYLFVSTSLMKPVVQLTSEMNKKKIQNADYRLNYSLWNVCVQHNKTGWAK